MEGKFRMELLVVGISVGIILWHLEGMTLGSDEVDGNCMLLLVAVSVDDNSSTWMTPNIDTRGGAIIVDEVVASVVAK